MFDSPSLEPEKPNLITAFSKGEQDSEHGRIDLEIEHHRIFPSVGTYSEGSLTSIQVADMLGTSRQTPHD